MLKAALAEASKPREQDGLALLVFELMRDSALFLKVFRNTAS